MNVSTIEYSPNLARFGSAAFYDGLSKSSRSTSNDFAGSFATASRFPAFTEATGGVDLPSARSADAAGLASPGMNAALADPKAAYRMMSLINRLDVAYKAQYSELSEMKSFLVDLEASGEDLARVASSSSDESIETRLQAFVEQYNRWIDRFDADLQNGGLLAGTQAARVSHYELEQSIENRFNGARDGLHGLSDLGVDIDPDTGRATFDAGKLRSTLAENRTGALHALQEFGANFAKSADLLTSDGNLVPNRLGNLDRVIHFISENKTSLQREFGTGEAARPSGAEARALLAYRRMSGS